MTNLNREMDYVAELLGQVLHEMVRERGLEETELSIEARLRQRISRDQEGPELTSNERMDHAVKLLREVLDEKVREERIRKKYCTPDSGTATAENKRLSG